MDLFVSSILSIYCDIIMGLTKVQNYSIEQNDMAQLAKAFAHPARVAIIMHLLRAKHCINSDLVEELGLAQATISQHLNELKHIGIIKGTVEGTSMNYCIDPETWSLAKLKFNDMFDQFELKDQCC